MSIFILLNTLFYLYISSDKGKHAQTKNDFKSLNWSTDFVKNLSVLIV